MSSNIGHFASDEMKGSEVNARVQNYGDYFDDSKSDEKKRQENYEDVVNSYYDLVTTFYTYGWGLSFHFTTQSHTETFDQAIARHEHYLALRMKLEPGMKIIDCGCGVGGPARNIARFSGASVLGINNNAFQVKLAKDYTKKESLSHLVSFQKGNFLEIPHGDATFEGAYAIEATCHAPNPASVYSEIYRVLKPGSYFAMYEWCTTDKYDPTNESHRKIKHGIEVGDGLPDLRTTHQVDAAIKEVGFELVEARDIVGDSQIPWYASLDGGFSLRNFRMTRIGRMCTHTMVSIMEFLRLAPKGTVETHNILLRAADDLVAGGKTGIFTPMYFVLCRKPL